MRIGVPRQTAPGEHRVALIPEEVARLTGKGHHLVVEGGAGSSAGFTDAAYKDAGASIADAAEAWGAEFVASVDQPPPDVDLGRVLIGLLRPFDEPDQMERMALTGVTAFAFEAIPRTTRAQSMDALSSQATIVGYQAVLEAAAAADRLFPMLTTAAGTLRPSKVLVLGAGVAGLQAIATARRLGAVVSAFDVRAAAAEQVRSLGASFVDLDVVAQDASTSGGYAREVAVDEQARILAGLSTPVAAADVVIATAAIPGRRAPVLIDSGMVEAMRPGAVIVDTAATTGGNCALTRPGETLVHNDVTIIGATDLVSRKPADASRMYARNVAAFLELVTSADGSLEPDWGDDIVAGSCITRDRTVVHPRLTRSVEA